MWTTMVIKKICRRNEVFNPTHHQNLEAILQGKRGILTFSGITAAAE
jgi:hypothetical protein